MANTYALTKIQDGPRNVVYHVFIESDGVSGEIVKEVVIDPAADLDPAFEAVPAFTIEKIVYSLVGFSAKLEFDYLASETPVWVLAGGQESEACFKNFGGLKDRSNVLDGTGKLLISTVGLTTAGDMGSILILVRKD